MKANWIIIYLPHIYRFSNSSNGEASERIPCKAGFFKLLLKVVYLNAQLDDMFYSLDPKTAGSQDHRKQEVRTIEVDVNTFDHAIPTMKSYRKFSNIIPANGN